MKVVREEILIDASDFGQSKEYAKIHEQILEGVSKVVWPPGTDKFTIFPEKNASGVKPIKIPFIRHLEGCGWRAEHRFNWDVTSSRPGPLDATCHVRGGLFAVEWETGNISSSHRAINKIVIGIMHGTLVGAALVLPSRDLYNYCTDRIGNLPELEPYFPLWRAVQCDSGFLVVIAVEHDEVSIDVPPIPKGTDGYGQGTGDDTLSLFDDHPSSD